MIWRKQWHLHWNETGDMQGSEKGLVVPPPLDTECERSMYNWHTDICGQTFVFIGEGL